MANKINTLPISEDLARDVEIIAPKLLIGARKRDFKG
jgi:hypothetical protein